MSTYALIAGGRVAEIAAATFDVHSDLTWVDVSSRAPQPEVGWSAAEASGMWTFAAPATAPETLAQQARAAIAASDVTMLRVADAVAVGKTTWTTADVVAWATYRRALRGIIDGTDTAATALPARPAYPANT